MTIAATTLILATLTASYNVAEGRTPIGWYEYQIADDIRRYVPLYDEVDRVRAKQFWKLDWDAPDLLMGVE